MSMQKRKPYENNHVMCYEDLKKFIINYIKTGEKEVTKDNFVRLVDYDKIRDDKDKDDSIYRPQL